MASRNENGKTQELISNPIEELAIKTEKYIKDCREMYLGNKGIVYLGNFERFTNIEELWINRNKISSLRGLEQNVRIKRLYAQHNQLSEIDQVSQFKFLEVLHVSNNRISNLTRVLNNLDKLKFLQDLDLTGNPVTEEPNYKLQVLSRLTWLHIFDRHVITEEDKIQAQSYSQRKQSRSKRNQDGPNYSKPENQELQLSTLTLDLKKQAERARRKKQCQSRQKEASVFAEALAMRNKNQSNTAPLPQTLDFLAKRKQREKSSHGPIISELDEWGRYQLKQLFQRHDKDKSRNLSKAELLSVLQEMQDMGKQVNPEQDLEVYFTAMDKNKNGTICWKEFEQALTGKLVDSDGNYLSSIKFTSIDPEVALKRSQELFDEMKSMERQLSCTQSAPDRQNIQSNILRLSQKAVHLQSIATDSKLNPRRAKSVSDVSVFDSRPSSRHSTHSQPRSQPRSQPKASRVDVFSTFSYSTKRETEKNESDAEIVELLVPSGSGEAIQAKFQLSKTIVEPKQAASIKLKKTSKRSVSSIGIHPKPPKPPHTRNFQSVPVSTSATPLPPLNTRPNQFSQALQDEVDPIVKEAFEARQNTMRIPLRIPGGTPHTENVIACKTILTL